jgi:hypothetical protein
MTMGGALRLNSPVYFPAKMGHLERDDWFRRDDIAIATLDSGRGYPLTVWRRSSPRPLGDRSFSTSLA